MKMSILCCLAPWALVLAAFSGGAHVPPTSGLIRPGEGVPGVDLGSKFSSFEAIFPKHDELDEDYTYPECGRVYHWLDLDKRANGVYAYLKNDEIYLLSVQTPRFALANGIAIEASEKRVKAAYPGGRGYVLLGSASVAVGGRDLRYWVDKKKGVAFEFSWYEKKKQRFVSAIDVFRRGSNYFPKGCISPPQQWQELKGRR